MTTLTDRPNTALLVVDLQVGVIDGAHERESVLRTVQQLVQRARAAGVAVIWVQDVAEDRRAGSPPWQLAEPLAPAEDEPRIDKSYGDAFAETDLERVLAERGVGRLVLTGAASEQCIRCTLHSGVLRGYDVDLVRGAHTTVDLTEWGMPDPATIIGFLDLVAGHGMEWPGRRGRSVGPDDVGF